ncbi:MAG: hypothetical protein WEB06_19430 [Actinomycetota bacterium]
MGAVIDAGQHDDEVDEGSDVIYLKYCFKGASSSAELAVELRSLAGELERRGADGWRMDAPIEDSWAQLVREERQ